MPAVDVACVVLLFVSNVPAVEALNQSAVSPAPVVTTKFCDPAVLHAVTSPNEIGAAGKEFTVIFTDCVVVHCVFGFVAATLYVTVPGVFNTGVVYVVAVAPEMSEPAVAHWKD